MSETNQRVGAEALAVLYANSTIYHEFAQSLSSLVRILGLLSHMHICMYVYVCLFDFTLTSYDCRWLWIEQLLQKQMSLNLVERGTKESIPPRLYIKPVYCVIGHLQEF